MSTKYRPSLPVGNSLWKLWAYIIAYKLYMRGIYVSGVNIKPCIHVRKVYSTRTWSELKFGNLTFLWLLLFGDRVPGNSKSNDVLFHTRYVANISIAVRRYTAAKSYVTVTSRMPT